MLEFFSASTRMVNSSRAMAICLEEALGEGQTNCCDLIVFHASLGHKYPELASQARKLAPKARIVGNSCCGIVGSEGVSESMKDLAVMAVRGSPGEIAVAGVDGIYGDNSFEKCSQLAAQLKQQNPDINMVYFMASGIDIANDRCLAGLESVLGPDVTIFGGTSSDNMKGVASFQVFDELVTEHGAWAVGFADPTLRVVTQATHGFTPVGKPMVVTKSSGHKILELNGRPAWTEYTSHLGLQPSATCGDSIPIGALAEKLPGEAAEEYGREHILRVVTKRDKDGTMYFATTCPEGTCLWLTKRDEDLIFSELDKMMENIVKRGSNQPVAVFHADCLARGRFMLNRVMKEEIVANMQNPLSGAGQTPPWLGMYGFGEFARLDGKNEYHNYTTAIYALFRDQ